MTDEIHRSIGFMVRRDEVEPAGPKPVSLGVGQAVINVARVEPEAAEMLSRGDLQGVLERQRAGTMVERVRGPAPEYMQEIGAGGEIVPTSKLAENPRAIQFQDTVRHPDFVAVDASRDRLELAHASGSLESALDLADSIQAQNSLEKMLAHQLTASHRATMKLAAQVNRRLAYLDALPVESERAQMVSIEAARLAGAAARIDELISAGDAHAPEAQDRRAAGGCGAARLCDGRGSGPRGRPGEHVRKGSGERGKSRQ
jgi:hypothetical protein